MSAGPDVGRYFDGAVRRVVAEWRQKVEQRECILELECGHRHAPQAWIAATVVGNFKFWDSTVNGRIDERELVRVPVKPEDRPARVCRPCRDEYVKRKTDEWRARHRATAT